MSSIKTQSQEIIVAGRVMQSAHAYCPSELSHPEKMRWMAEYFLNNYVAPHAAATDGNAAQKVTDILDLCTRTDAPLRICQQALVTANGDVDKALAMIENGGARVLS